MNTEVRRAVRVAEEIRAELTQTLTRDVADPRTREVVVTRVVLSDDLQIARVYIRLASATDNEASREAALRGLRSASPLLRRKLGSALALRRIPELRFWFDEGQDAQDRIDALLREIAEESK